MFKLSSVAARLSVFAVFHMSSLASGGGPETPGSSVVPARRLLRLSSVPGFEQHRLNDLLLLLSPEDTQSKNRHVVFFPGDIQNFQQEMALQPEAAPWQCWSLERVAVILSARFPECHIWVVRASRMYLHKFSCYQNFVESNLFGAPEHSSDYGAVRHLRGLLGHGMEQAGLPDALPPLGGAKLLPHGFSLILVGFSKGCVVLNQMVYELAGAQSDPELKLFLDSISDIYWLDGGHPGGSETWVTDKRALGELAACRMALHAHVTPYEVQDPMRAWVGREHRRFVKTLEELGACITHKLHFESEAASIENHFRVIKEF